MSDLVESPEVQFSNIVVHITMTGQVKDNSNLSDIVYMNISETTGFQIE